MMPDPSARHVPTRFRQEPKRRTLRVLTLLDLTPHMRRIVFTSPELADFDSPGPDDHIKLFVPDPSEPGGMAMRDYTPRSFDPVAKTLVIDFALHETGPATNWARTAHPGARLQIGGPRGSVIVPDDFDHYLLIGDETALPAIGRRLETLRPGVPVTALMVVEGPEEVQGFETRAALTPGWVFRRGSGTDDATLLRAALASWPAPGGDGYVWIAAEAAVARSLRDYMLTERGHRREWLKSSGYWVRGVPGAHEKHAAA